MSRYDLLIVAFIIIYGFIGMKKGFIKELVSFLGFFIIIILSFLLKNPISKMLYLKLPFLNIGIYKNLAVYNILFYEVLAFFIVAAILLIIFRVVLFMSKVLQKLINMTVLMKIPSKILGFIIGLIEGYVWLFIILYIISIFAIENPLFKESKLCDNMMKNTVILSSFTSDYTNAINDINYLKTNDAGMESNQFNYEAVKIMLKYGIIDIDSVNTLNDSGKMKIDNIESLKEENI